MKWFGKDGVEFLSRATTIPAHQHTNKNFLLSAIDRDENGELYWRSTGQTVRYTNWAGRHPSGPVPCVAIDRYSFKWMSPDCKKNEYHPFCEKGKGSTFIYLDLSFINSKSLGGMVSNFRSYEFRGGTNIRELAEFHIKKTCLS